MTDDGRKLAESPLLTLPAGDGTPSGSLAKLLRVYINTFLPERFLQQQRKLRAFQSDSYLRLRLDYFRFLFLHVRFPSWWENWLNHILTLRLKPSYRFIR